MGEGEDFDWENDGPKDDVFAAGVIMVELLSGVRMPHLLGPQGRKAYRSLRSHNFLLTHCITAITEECGPAERGLVKELVGMMLNDDAASRIEAGKAADFLGKALEGAGFSTNMKYG